jgi:hypothetical protein
VRKLDFDGLPKPAANVEGGEDYDGVPLFRLFNGFRKLANEIVMLKSSQGFVR